MFPEKELPEFFEERLPFSCLASLRITRERRGYGTKISQESSREEKKNNIYITDGLGSWIGSEGPVGDGPALNFTRKYPQIHKETYSHWLGISSLSIVGRYRRPALLLRMGPVLFFFPYSIQLNQNIYIFSFLEKTALTKSGSQDMDGLIQMADSIRNISMLSKHSPPRDARFSSSEMCPQSL